MRRVFVVIALAVSPAVAMAADLAVPGSGAGVYAAAGAFLGQLASAAIVRRAVRRGVTDHEARCRHFRGPQPAADP